MADEGERRGAYTLSFSLSDGEVVSAAELAAARPPGFSGSAADREAFAQVGRLPAGSRARPGERRGDCWAQNCSQRA